MFGCCPPVADDLRIAGCFPRLDRLGHLPMDAKLGVCDGAEDAAVLNQGDVGEKVCDLAPDRQGRRRDVARDPIRQTVAQIRRVSLHEITGAGVSASRSQGR